MIKVGKEVLAFVQAHNSHPTRKNANFEKIVFMVRTSGRHQTLNDTHPGMVISCTKFHVCTPSSFGGVKVHLVLTKQKFAV